MHFAVPEQVEEETVRQETFREVSMMSGVSYAATNDYTRDSMSICVDEIGSEHESREHGPAVGQGLSMNAEWQGFLEEEARNQPWKLHLPIYGSIALRRAFKKNLDPEEVMREQGVRARHEIELKYGALRDVDVTFKPIDWSAEGQPHSQMVAHTEGEPVSPTVLPAPRYMSAAGEERALPVGPDDPVPSIEDPNANLPRPRIMTRSWGIGYRLVTT